MIAPQTCSATCVDVAVTSNQVILALKEGEHQAMQEEVMISRKCPWCRVRPIAQRMSGNPSSAARIAPSILWPSTASKVMPAFQAGQVTA